MEREIGKHRYHNRVVTNATQRYKIGAREKGIKNFEPIVFAPLDRGSNSIIKSRGKRLIASPRSAPFRAAFVGESDIYRGSKRWRALRKRINFSLPDERSIRIGSSSPLCRENQPSRASSLRVQELLIH